MAGECHWVTVLCMPDEIIIFQALFSNVYSLKQQCLFPKLFFCSFLPMFVSNGTLFYASDQWLREPLIAKNGPGRNNYNNGIKACALVPSILNGHPNGSATATP